MWKGVSEPQPFEQIEILPCARRFLTDHATTFIKVMEIDPVDEYVGATWAAEHKVRALAPLAPPIASDGLWLLAYPYEDLVPMGLSLTEQRAAAEVMRKVWSTPPPAGAIEKGLDAYRVTAASHLDAIEARGTDVSLWREAQAKFLTWAETTIEARSPRRAWVHGDAHHRNFSVRGDGTLLLVDWERHHVAPREQDAAKFVQSALAEAGPESAVPGTYLDGVTGAGVDLDLVNVLVPLRMLNARIYQEFNLPGDPAYAPWREAMDHVIDEALAGRLPLD